MDFAKVTVEVRSQTGKGSARRARAAGRVPGVLYGMKENALPLSVDPSALAKSMDKEKRRNTVFSLAVGDNGKSSDVLAMIRDVQIDPLSQRVMHVDFLRVSLDKEVTVTVPLHLKGTAVGVTDGGNLHHSMHAVPIAAKPDAIPAKLEIDVSALKIGEALHASDLKLPAGLRVLLNPKEAIASVVAPKAEKVETTTAAPAEGAAAAPAAGAAGAAAAPAAGGEAKKEEKKGK